MEAKLGLHRVKTQDQFRLAAERIVFCGGGRCDFFKDGLGGNCKNKAVLDQDTVVEKRECRSACINTIPVVMRKSGPEVIVTCS